MGSSARKCNPSDHTVDGQGYCTDRSNGWYDGGSGLGNQRSNPNSKCWKEFRYCDCPDCGGGDVQCKDWRCNDEVGVSDRVSGCTVQGVQRKDDIYDFCYKSFKACEPCPFGAQRQGCMRASPGTCVKCFGNGIPPSGTFLISTGTKCETQACSTVPPGKYLVTPCSATQDTQMDVCSNYPGRDNIPGNPKSILAGYMGQAYWYCPAGGLPQRLPINAVPTPDYASYVCSDGFYQDEAGLCLSCPPGSACLYGRKFLCPPNYYSRTPASASCTLCTFRCVFSDELPMRCLAGSTQDKGCVNCNMCGFSLSDGLQCNENTDAMQQLKATCVPLPSSGDTAVCQ